MTSVHVPGLISPRSSRWTRNRDSFDDRRAAQYIRMSTDHQQYATANQQDAIARYAIARGLEVVKTYTDEGGEPKTA